MKYIITVNENSKKYLIEELKIHKEKIIIEKWLDKKLVLISSSLNFVDLYSLIVSFPIVTIRHIFEIKDILTIDELNTLEIRLKKLYETVPLEDSINIQVRTISKKIESHYLKEIIMDNIRRLGYILNNQAEYTVTTLCIDEVIYIGYNESYLNLSIYSGGEIHYKKNKDVISRAEFKLLELFELVDFNLKDGFKALDLGAAPGGWSKVLLHKNMKVYAVDPGKVNELLLENSNFVFYNESAQQFLSRNKKIKFDFIVNDMKMDVRKSLSIMMAFNKMAVPSTIFILTVKLPKKGKQQLVSNIMQSIQNCYNIIFARQLFHNRAEITVVFKLK